MASSVATAVPVKQVLLLVFALCIGFLAGNIQCDASALASYTIGNQETQHITSGSLVKSSECEEMSAEISHLERTIKNLESTIAALQQHIKSTEVELTSTRSAFRSLDKRLTQQAESLTSTTTENRDEGDTISTEKTTPTDSNPNVSRASREFSRLLSAVKTSKSLQGSTLTETAARRSRPLVGNTDRFHKLLHRIVNEGHCARFMFIGGSVTRGYNIGGYDKSYTVMFMDYLNEKYPCKNGGKHIRMLQTQGGSGSDFGGTNFHRYVTLTEGQIDMLFVEFAPNDGHTAFLEGQENSGTVQVYTESLVRQALLYRNRDGTFPAVAYLETTWRGKPVADHKTKSDLDFTKTFAAAVHHPILAYYNIPTISTTHMWLPLSVQVPDQYFPDKSENPWSWFSLMVDACCHPRRSGHLQIAQVLAYNFEMELDWMKEGPELSEWEKDRTTWDEPILPDLFRMSTKQETQMVLAPTSMMNIGDDVPSKASLLFNNGWDIFADSKGKLGIITYTSGSHFAVKIHLSPESKGMEGAEPKAFVGYLSTYENVSPAVFWVDDHADGRKMCTKLVKKNPGLCYETECDYQVYKKKYFNKASGPWGTAPESLRKVLMSFPKSLERPGNPKMDGKDWGFTQDAFPDTMMSVVFPRSKYKVSIYEHTNLDIPDKLRDKAVNSGEALYIHACSVRFNEYNSGANLFAGPNERADPFEGDTKFKVLAIGAHWGTVEFQKADEKERKKFDDRSAEFEMHRNELNNKALESGGKADAAPIAARL